MYCSFNVRATLKKKIIFLLTDLKFFATMSRKNVNTQFFKLAYVSSCFYGLYVMLVQGDKKITIYMKNNAICINPEVLVFV